MEYRDDRIGVTSGRLFFFTKTIGGEPDGINAKTEDICR